VEVPSFVDSVEPHVNDCYPLHRTPVPQPVIDPSDDKATCPIDLNTFNSYSLLYQTYQHNLVLQKKKIEEAEYLARIVSTRSLLCSSQVGPFGCLEVFLQIVGFRNEC
jgi:hypothetical protein